MYHHILTRRELREVYEHFKAGKKEEVGREILPRGIEVEIRAVELCREEDHSSFLIFYTVPDCHDAVLSIRTKMFSAFDICSSPECFHLSVPSGLVSTEHFTLGSCTFAAVAAVMSKIAEIAHPEIHKQLMQTT